MSASPLVFAGETKESWSVTGTVTTVDGEPVSGARIRVSTGWGTLGGGGEGKSDAAGQFRVEFGPGITFLPSQEEKSAPGFDPEAFDRVRVQAAAVFVGKPGFYEVHLCEDGNLVMSSKAAAESARTDYQWAAGVVAPNDPYEVHFVMAPAAEVHGRLLDQEGNPIWGQKVYIDSDKRPPATSVLDSAETDETGAFSFTDVPLQPFWFSTSVDRTDMETEPIELLEAARYEFELTLDDRAEALHGWLVSRATDDRDQVTR